MTVNAAEEKMIDEITNIPILNTEYGSLACKRKNEIQILNYDLFLELFVNSAGDFARLLERHAESKLNDIRLPHAEGFIICMRYLVH